MSLSVPLTHPALHPTPQKKALKRLGPQKKGAGEQAAASKKATVLKTVDERTPEEKRAFDDLTELADQLLRWVFVCVWGELFG